jgi:hypothetical protein
MDTQTQVYEGPDTRSRTKKIHQDVHAFLSELYCNVDESHVLLLLRFTQEAYLLGYVKDTRGYMEDTKTVVQAEKGYAHETLGYAAKASTSRPSLYHLGKRRGPSDISLGDSWS